MSKEKPYQDGYDPYWRSDFLDIKIKKLSRTAFIMLQMYRSFRDIKTSICKLSDLDIRSITGWDQYAIKKARIQLISLGEISPIGYRLFKVKEFRKFDESIGETPKPSKDGFRGNPETGLGKTPNKLGGNPETGLGENLIPLLTDNTDRDNTDTFSSLSPVKKPVNNLKAFCCKDCSNYMTDYADRAGNKSSLCSVLKIKLPPYTMAANCEHFKNLFLK